MIVDALHITEKSVAVSIAERMRAGEHGLLNMPDSMTVGGCFWAVVTPTSDAGLLAYQELPDPYSGRTPVSPVPLRLRIDLGAPTTFALSDLANIHAEILLGLAAQVPGLASLKAIFAHAGNVGVAGPILANRADLHLRGLVPQVGAWIRGPTPSYQHCPFNAAYFGITPAQHASVFRTAGLNAAQGQLWNEVGRRIGAGPGTGWVQLPAGCYLSRTGGGAFAIVRNAQVQDRIAFVDDHRTLMNAARHASGHHSIAGDLG